MDFLDEAILATKNVALVNRAVTKRAIEKKTGIKVLTRGKDFGEIVTNVDIGVSDALLCGGIPGVHGFRTEYPGSFSEEQDFPERSAALDIIQVDPIDGTGDFVDTHTSPTVMAPTTLVSRLSRKSAADPFETRWGIIFDTINEFAIVSDGKDILLFSVTENGELKDVPWAKTEPREWQDDSLFAVNRRISYPQLTFDGPFMGFLRKQGLNPKQTPSGGAGSQAMMVFRNYIQPLGRDAESFERMTPLTICFNAQPDWKTWDTNPSEIIAQALGLPERTDIFGERPAANAKAEKLGGMHHTKGFVISTNRPLQVSLCSAARRFSEANPDCSLLSKDYGYKDAIMALAPKA